MKTEEIQYLIQCVDVRECTSTQEVRNKSFMLNKLCDMLENGDQKKEKEVPKDKK